MFTKKRLLVGAALLFGALLFLVPVFVNQNQVQAAGDCDSNAVIYCGASSISDLTNKLNKGTGKQYQSSKELKALFAKYNAYTSDFSQLKNGTVKKDNKVYVGNHSVASNVYTMGRHNISGSTKITGLSYPLYKRHPSVSFVPNSLDAWVYLNYDGTMRYAIIKSCGNIVMGVVHNPPPPPTQTSLANLTIKKFNDVNGNKVQDSGEPTLGGWEFRVNGAGVNQVVSTLPDGTVTLSGLTPGVFTVTELIQDGWKNTTGVSITRNVTTDVATQTFVFGNQEVTPVTPTGGGEVVTLPVTGTKEWVLAGLVLVILGASLWWVRSKDMLRLAKKRKPTGKTGGIKKGKK